MNGAIQGAAAWMAALLAGQLALGLGILAISGIGLAALNGTLRRETALRVLIGVLILFAAPQLAQQALDWSAGGTMRSPAKYTTPGQDKTSAQTICWTCR